jgi:hypothetical protein
MLSRRSDVNVIWKISAVMVTLGLAACARGPAVTAGDDVAAAATPAATTRLDAQPVAAQNLPNVIAYRSPTCGCCELWVEHMRAAGFQVDIKNTDDIGAIKAEAGVPVGKGSCHTARVGDYWVEGHVPASDVKRLLAENPDARGLVVPGMVHGSPGMEQGGATQPYDVLLIAKDGSTSVFSHHGD